MKDQLDHRFLVDHVRHRLQELQIGEPVEFRIGHTVFDEVARVAIEAEEQRAGVDANFLDRDVEFVVLHLVLQRRNLLGARTVNVDLPRQVAQVGGVLILHDRHVLPVQARQLAAVLVLHPIVVVAIVVDDLALRVPHHLVRAVADDFLRRSVDAPGMIEVSGLPHRFENVRRHHLDAERIEQRRERLGQVHDDGVIVGRLGCDALMVDSDRGTDAVRHFRIVDDVEREQDVVRCHRLPVKPFRVVTEMKRDRLVVGRDVPFLGQPGLRQRRDGVDAEQALEQIAGELARGRVGDQNRIEGARIAGDGGVQDLILRVIAVGPADVASGENRERRQGNRAGDRPVKSGCAGFQLSFGNAPPSSRLRFIRVAPGAGVNTNVESGMTPLTIGRR